MFCDVDIVVDVVFCLNVA